MEKPENPSSIGDVERLVDLAEGISDSANRMEFRISELRQRQFIALMILSLALVLALAAVEQGAWRWAAAPVILATLMHIWLDGRQASRKRRQLRLEVHIQNTAVNLLRETESTLLKDASSVRQALIRLRLTRFPIEREISGFFG